MAQVPERLAAGGRPSEPWLPQGGKREKLRTGRPTGDGLGATGRTAAELIVDALRLQVGAYDKPYADDYELG